jgi:tetratricopeptide (TPR) repeat protein
MQLLSGLDNGLQNSVLKREVLEAHLLPDFRVGEDRLFIIMALKSGFKMAFIDAIHVRYHVHGENISDTNKKELDFEKRIRALEQLIASKKSLPNLVQLNSKERQAFKKQLSRELFWELGYSLYQDSGELYKAMKCYLEAIYLYPYTPKYYKTLAGSIIRRLLQTLKRQN